jgi:3-hydroxyisobutyrate dehydrogenase-like beta-hydroxyacid dehydrogenase
MSSIGFAGLGSMGAPIAGRLLQGHQVFGTNRTKEKAAGLGQMAVGGPGQQVRDAA